MSKHIEISYKAWIEEGSEDTAWIGYIYNHLKQGYTHFWTTEPLRLAAEVYTGMGNFRVFKDEEGEIVSLYGWLHTHRDFPFFLINFKKCKWQEVVPDTYELSEFIIQVEYMERLGIPVQSSPNATGKKLLTQELKQTSAIHWVEKDPIDASAPCFIGHPALEYLWTRDIMPDEVGMYAHYFDRNSAYLGSCTGLALGGHAFHIRTGSEYAKLETHEAIKTEVLEKGLPAFYQVSGLKRFYTEHEGSNDPFSIAGQHIQDRMWLEAHLVKLLFECEYAEEYLFLEAAYYWVDHHRILEKWAQHLWWARMRARETKKDYKDAEDLIKWIALKTVGVWGKKSDDAPYWGNWHFAIIGRTRELMIRKMQKFTQLAGRQPISAYVDGIWVPSASLDYRDDPYIAQVFTRPTELGGWKYKYTCTLEPEYVEGFNEFPKNAYNKRHLLLKNLGQSEDYKLRDRGRI